MVASPVVGSPFPVRVIVDDRERASAVVGHLHSQDEVIVSIRRLSVGDYLVDDRLVVERKTVSDFGASLKDGRLFRQAYRLMRDTHPRVCLVLEGTRSDLRWVGLSRAALQGALLTLTLSFDIPVLRSMSEAETARVILIAAEQLRRRRGTMARRMRPQIRDLHRLQLLMLQGVPEIGPVKAMALLERFGTPAGLANASVEELSKVRGIGPRTAERLFDILHSNSRKRIAVRRDP